MAGAFGRDPEYLALLNEMAIEENLRKGRRTGGSNSQMQVLGENVGGEGASAVEGIPAEMMEDPEAAVAMWGEGPVPHKIGAYENQQALDLMDGPTVQPGWQGAQSGPAEYGDYHPMLPGQRDRRYPEPDMPYSPYSDHPGTGFTAPGSPPVAGEGSTADASQHPWDLGGAFLESVDPSINDPQQGPPRPMPELDWMPGSVEGRPKSDPRDHSLIPPPDWLAEIFGMEPYVPRNKRY
jgi:hypothetical protein